MPGTLDATAPGSAPTTAPALLVTVTGADRPGVTSALFTALAGTDAEVLDVEQVVVGGVLTLAVLVGTGDPAAVTATLAGWGAPRGLDVTCTVREPAAPVVRPRRLHVTLLGAPLRPAAIARTTAVLAERGANVDRVRRMSATPVTSVEFDVSVDAGAEEVLDLRRALAVEAARHGLDAAVSPGGLARLGRRLVVMDVDSTLIRQEVIELLAAHAGREAEVAAVTERAMRGEIDFAASLRERVACLEGLDVSVVERVREAVVLTPGARTLCRTLHRLGFTLALVSGGFLEVVGPLAAELGIAHVRANRLQVVHGRFTGRLLGPVVDRAAKATALREFAAAEGLPMHRTVAVGDGANDLDMIGAAGLGIAFNAKPVVREQADAALNVPYLDAVLPLLGITREDVEDADLADEALAGQVPAGR
ncbi:phosphoserine phosphatase SerB [Paenibacillus sp. TRM 82003]|uniref:phosphoserine phosphatase SerB n=1 Tax=Kineococcus sp. TRM81007 TaxID=2925831 RepID=UPI001F55B006|nr:phosphoserine phosphatase SerB [Kineococcus sp. TRM81007]MCI2237656.1 phosphoserine phosphatase SerB [Kineococcus sp. TRM81007]MCI3921673.1 phosphoserine phosphatase SerB [Paenibacillus sp. TRM 82003]